VARSYNKHDLAYERIADKWAELISAYDTQRRMETLLGSFLGTERIRGKHCLDAGCGLGFFTKGLLSMGAAGVVAVDIAPSLVSRLQKECLGADCRVGDLMDLSPSIGNETFEIIVSSEVIEHTPNPERAVTELTKRVAPGGWLAISCPNARWRWLLSAVQALGMRKAYEGYENWVRPQALKTWMSDAGLVVSKAEGIHCLPWQISERLVSVLDRRLARHWYGRAINLALLAQRPTA
jgi:2-polyprenyl-6-hydroxyphenyl methylase/3-demethylubiquinone-9 3-methyltransferase